MLEQGVREGEPLGGPVDLGHHRGARRLFEGVEHGALVALRDAGQQTQIEVAADDRRHRQDLLHVVAEASHPLAHHLAHALGQPDLGQLDRAHPAPVLLADGGRLHQVPEHLGSEERVSSGLAPHCVSELDAVIGHLMASQALQLRHHTVVVEATNRDPFHRRLAPKSGQPLGQGVRRGEVAVTVGSHHQYLGPVERGDEVA